MGKAVAAIIVVVLLLIGGIVYATTRHAAAPSSSTSQMNMPSMSPTQSSQSSSSNSTQSSTNSVTIENFAFSPASITVKKGTTVTWTNKDGTAHTVVETDGKTGPKSGTLGNGQTYSFTYNTVGTFDYNCSIHPNMLGSVTVTE
jgi:plastocyanin